MKRLDIDEDDAMMKLHRFGFDLRKELSITRSLARILIRLDYFLNQ